MHIEASDRYKLILARLKTLAWAALLCVGAASFHPYRGAVQATALVAIFALVAFVALGGVQILIGLMKLYLPRRRARIASRSLRAS